MAFQRFVVLYSDYEQVDGHVEYIFDVTHTSKCTWTIRWRFSELATAHKELASSLPDLPPFPAKGVPGLGIVLGEDFILRRAVALQGYFAEALASEVAGTDPGFQSVLGVQVPAPVTSVRVLRWITDSFDASGSPLHACSASVELEVTMDEPVGCRPVESLVAAPQLAGGLGCLLPAASVSFPGAVLQLKGLPCGEEMVLEVRAQNGVGISLAVMIDIHVPGRRRELVSGARVRAVWAGDGARYDAVIKRIHEDGSVLVSWLRPRPLCQEVQCCVCEHGGDDTAHRVVRREWVVPVTLAGGHVCSSPPDCDHASLVQLMGHVTEKHDLFDDIHLLEHEDFCGLATLEQRESNQESVHVVCGLQAPLTRCVNSVPRRKEVKIIDETRIAEPPCSARASQFRLRVRLSDQPAAALEWSSGEELAPRVSQFVIDNKLKPLFEELLMTQAQLMLSNGPRDKLVDIVDLLDHLDHI